MDKRLLDILVCPLCKGKLVLEKATDELICRADKLAYPIRDGIPGMLIAEARPLHQPNISNNEQEPHGLNNKT